VNVPTTTDFPLRLGSRAQFEAVRSVLHNAGFDEGTLCGVLKVTALSELGTLQRTAIDLENLARPLSLLIRLFLLGETIAPQEFEAELGPDARSAFLALDLVRRGQFGGGCYYTPVFLYPVEEFLVVSDRQSNPDGSPFVEPLDMVFAALYPGTHRFLQIFPNRNVDEALDLCSGTGIGALKLSCRARRVVATDITERSAHFMRFNEALNSCENVEVAVGDLFAAVSGRRFDVIVAHPPYVPSVGDNVIYRDGGDAGETILRRIVEGLPSALRAGGTFYSMGVGIDTQQGRFEERARGWLGEAQAAFDVIFAMGDEKTPDKAVNDIVERARNIKTLDAGRLVQAYQQLGTIGLVYGGLVIHRRPEPASPAETWVAPWTARPRLSAQTTGDDFDGLLDWHRRSVQPGYLESLADLHPTLSPHLQVNVSHRVQNGALVPVEFMLETSRPFETATRLEGWMVPLMARFDGHQSSREVHESARIARQIPAAFGLEDFLKLVALLIERGYLVVPAWREAARATR
jgi:SAM-dependent methyltransferase